MDFFSILNKLHYYADASETLHESLYGCTYNVGAFDPEFDRNNVRNKKKLYKDSACILLHLGMLIHESFMLISYSNDRQELCDGPYKNRNQSLNLLFHVLEKKVGIFKKEDIS